MDSQKWLEEYVEFFEPMISEPSLKRTIQIGIKEIRARVDWRERDEAEIIYWFKSAV